ncbi:MAG TPA: hypothetical protein VJS12_03255 [Steroidobacteraceae bacterium]|nr:hypothetical protein [Steroidobacteraceae bacterium]
MSCRKTPRRLVTPQFICPVVLFAALAAGNAGAANWEIAPRVAAGYRYSDNYHLGPPGTEVEVSGAEAEAGVTFRTLDPRTQIEITPSVQGTYFGSDSDDNLANYYLDASYLDNTPRRRMGVTGQLSREDVTRSELPEGGDTGGDLGSPPEGDSGRFVQHNDRTFARIAPFFSYDVSQRQVVDFAAHYTRADFENQLQGAQVDWSDAGVEAGWGYRTSERSTFSLRGVASRYETVFDTDAYGAYVQWDTKFSETSRVYVRVGAQQSEPENGESDTSVLAGVGGSWNTLRNRLFLDLTRDVQPVAAGTVVERYQLRMQINHEVSPRVSLVLAARGSHDEDIAAGGTFPTRKYAAAEGGFEWRVLRNFAVTATYGYRWQEYADELSDRSMNTFLVSLVYEPKRPE